MSGVPIRLSTTKPDFQSLCLQLQLYLSTKDAWVDQQTSATGQSIVEAVASVGAFNQFAAEMNFREAFLYTAQRDSSIYACADLLGVHVQRKTPAKAPCIFQRTGNVSQPLLIPRLSVFQINNVNFFNRDPISFLPNSAVSNEVFLYCGDLRTQTFQGKSTSFQELSLNEPSFVVSDDDVYVIVSNTSTGESTAWTKSVDGLWIADSDDTVYYDRTNGLGDVVLTFGDGTHGVIPSLGLEIKITYAVTNGSTGNNGGSNLPVSYALDSNIKGVTSNAIVGGADEKPAFFYKVLAPQIFRARGRAVNPEDYQAIAASYPGVASAIVKAQRDIAPNDLRWMNIVRICILPAVNDAFANQEWLDFLAYFESRKHAAVDIQRYDPTKRDADVSIRVALRPTAIPGEVFPQIQEKIRALFARNLDALGKRIAVSDIVDAAIIADVDYVQVLQPTTDLFLTEAQDPQSAYVFWNLNSLNIELFYSERRLFNT